MTAFAGGGAGVEHAGFGVHDRHRQLVSGGHHVDAVGCQHPVSGDVQRRHVDGGR
jgi:hypothetical protein